MKIVALILLSLTAVTTAAFAEPSPSAAAAAPGAPAAQAAKDAAAPSAPAKDTPAAGNSVRYANDKITLDVKNMSAADLVDEIARQANAKVTGSVGGAAPVTANQKDVPLKVALEHMLGAQNFTLTYSEQGELRVIQLRGQQQQQKQGPANGSADVSPNDKNRASASEMALFKAFDLPCQTEIPIDGAISRRLGRDKARLDLIANTTISDSDPNVRQTGMKAMMKMFDGDQTLRGQVMTTTNGMTDAQLAAFARAYMFHWAENFVHGIKAESSDPDVRRRAGAVLRELRNNPYTGPIPPEASQPLPPA